MEKAQADELFSRAIAQQQAGELDAAQAAYEQVLAAFPQYPHAPHLLGVIVSQRGQWFLARRLIETSLLSHANDADALSNLGWVLFNLGEFARAVTRCDQAISLNPAHARALLTRGMALRFSGRFEEAIASFERALALNPNMAEALNYRGQSLHALGRFEEALRSYDQALQLHPQYADVYNNRGASLTLLDRHDEAAQSFLQALQLQPRFPEALFNRGLGLQNAEQFEQALACYDAALALKPDYPEALMHRAFALQRLRRLPQDCVASLDKALALRPDFFEAINGRANILAQLEQYTEALENYDRALAIRPDFHDALLNRGHALRELGRLDEAAESYREALRHGGDAEGAQFALAALGQEQAPPMAPREYIVNLFDRYADRFDEHLVTRLGYQAHERLCEALLALQPPPGDVLDLGCGTGLCAPLLKPVARGMTGVDLSPRMLDEARKRGIYTQLTCADVTTFLEGQAAAGFDIVVSTDVFIYIGDLQAVFAGVRKCLRPQGLFGFSIEASDSEDFVLRESRRYAQSPAYIRRLARLHGLEVLSLTACAIRKEREEYLPGYIGILKAA